MLANGVTSAPNLLQKGISGCSKPATKDTFACSLDWSQKTQVACSTPELAKLIEDRRSRGDVDRDGAHGSPEVGLGDKYTMRVSCKP